MGAVSRMSSYWEVVRQYFGKTEPNKEHSNDQESDKQRYDYYNNEEQTSILYLPEDILLLILQYLPPKDLISLEKTCSLIRGLIVQYNVYKTRLDKIFRFKRLNNYMALSEAACREKTAKDVSGYYKYRLYKYTYRLLLKPIEEEDDYIQTYKVGKKKQELDELVAKNIRRFSLTGLVLYIEL